MHKFISDKFGRIVAWTLLLSAILQTYGWGKYDFAFVITVLLAIINLLRNGFHKEILPRYFFAFIVFWYMSHLVAGGSILHLGIIRVLLVYYLFFDTIDITYFIKQYERVAMVCIIFFFVQEISVRFTGTRIPGVFQFLPLAVATDSASYYLHMAEMSRSASFFSEPAHFVQFLLPLLAVEVFFYQKIKVKWVIVICLTLLLLQSGNALFGMIAIFLVYMYTLHFKTKISYRIPLVLMVGVLVAGIGYFYLSSDMGQKLLDRKNTISLSDVENRGYGGSGFMRISRGYYVFNEYSAFKKIIGDDTSDYIDDAISRSPVSMFFKDDDRYLNTIQTTLCYTGFVGLFLFVLMIIGLWKDSGICGRAVLMTFISLSFIAALFFSESMAIYMLIPYCLKQNKL